MNNTCLINKDSRCKYIEKELERVGRLFHIYDSDYVDELEDACNQWNELIRTIKKEKLNINWRKYI